ncbi:MAG: hypothetical protein ACRENG_33500 [bacterium]
MSVKCSNLGLAEVLQCKRNEGTVIHLAGHGMAARANLHGFTAL